MKIRENLGGITSALNRTYSYPTIKNQIGKVFGIVLGENIPSKELFEKVGGWNGIGTIFYLDYEQYKDIEQVDLNNCKIAKPFNAGVQDYPLLGELVLLMDGPSYISQLNDTSTQKYYLGTINIWNNNQQNTPSGDSLGKSFIESSDIRKLITFEGDRIYQGRKGNGIRFGSTTKLYSDKNEWSKVGKDGDPITMLVNGYVTADTGSLSPNVEEINKEKSSIYLTSTQSIPLQPGARINNPIQSSLLPKDYIHSQIILNSDRITLNSKKNEILLFAKTNIELNSDNIININSGKYIHFHIDHLNPNSKILLGTKSDKSIPTEPVLLGNKTHDLLLEICNTLGKLAGYLVETTVPTSDGGINIPACNNAGIQLYSDIDNLLSKLNSITSNKVYTV